jgi:acyl-coenzyme A thioesterase PaaI-like protein
MRAENRFSRMMNRVARVPGPLRTRARTLLLSRVVKFVGTAKLEIEELTAERAVVSVKNRRIVQNHIGGVHAAAMALLAETATGFVVGMNVPDDRVPVIKSLKVEYKKRATGGLRAVASLTPEQIERMRTTEKGDVVVSVIVTDDAGIEPIVCEMIWAWVPKKR